MTQQPRDTQNQASETPGFEARGVRRSPVGQSVSSASAARTRTLEGQTVEFKAVDYQPAEHTSATTDTRPRAVEPVAKLGKASGVSSLRSPDAAVSKRSSKAPLSRNTIIAIAVGLVVLAAVVFVGGYFVARSVFSSVNDNASSVSSGAYATDAYTIFAVEGGDGNLRSVYLTYVDSINERVELCWIQPNTYFAEDGVLGLVDLAGVFEQRGFDTLVNAVSSSADVSIAAAMLVDEAQMDKVLALVVSNGDGVDPVVLAQEIWNENQQVSEAALRGLLVTMKQISPEDHVILTAPTEETTMEGHEDTLVLRHQDWLRMVRGMRDPSEAAALGGV